MKRLFLNTLLCTTLTAGAVATVAASELELVVDGVRNDRGDVWIMLYRGPTGFSTQDVDAAEALVKLPARNGRVAVTLQNLEPGNYAVAVLHDENGNGKSDQRHGIPTEGYGFTRDAGRSAAPTFEQASLSLPENRTAQVDLVYLSR